MFGLSLGHLLILFVVLLLFRNKSIPQLARGLGGAVRSFKKGIEKKPME